jgi:hypothetical protein
VAILWGNHALEAVQPGECFLFIFPIHQFFYLGIISEDGLGIRDKLFLYLSFTLGASGSAPLKLSFPRSAEGDIPGLDQVSEDRTRPPLNLILLAFFSKRKDQPL